MSLFIKVLRAHLWAETAARDRISPTLTARPLTCGNFFSQAEPGTVTEDHGGDTPKPGCNGGGRATKVVVDRFNQGGLEWMCVLPLPFQSI